MAQPEFLVRTANGEKSFALQIDKLSPRHPEILRKAARQPLSGLFVTMAGTGKYETGFELDAEGQGWLGKRDTRRRFPATAEGVKSVVRRLRDREAAELDELDAEMETLRVALGALRNRRLALIKKAWANGNVVRLAEVEEAARIRAQ